MARRPRNQNLPGTEREQFQELDDAIDNYTDTRDTWQEQGEALTKAKSKLVELMNAHGLVKYRKGDLMAELKHNSSDNVKVKAVKPDMVEEDQLLTAAEAAQILRVSEAYLYKVAPTA